MTALKLIQVDAFADRPFSGNPAAVMPLDAWLPDETLQAIANENNLSETAFAIPDKSGAADYELRWFTPTVEVALCGHATLASGHVLIERDEIRFRTRKAGVLTVSREGDALTLDLPPILVEPARNETLLAALGTPDAGYFLSYAGVEDTAIVLLEDAAAVRACAPDFGALAKIDVMAIVTARAEPDADHEIVSRVFVSAWGIDEDPVTGSAHAALVPFWNDQLECGDTIRFFQASRRGGHLSGRMAGERVVLGGRCVTVIEGIMRI